MRNVTLYSLTILCIAAILGPAHADILTAEFETPVLDGDGTDFTGAPIVTSTGVTMKAAYNLTDLYILAVWADTTTTESVDKNTWTYSLGSWSKSGNEDRLAIIWDINASDFPSFGCAAVCHMGMRMRTLNPGETVDTWHWKAARGNAMGFVDDKYFDNAMDTLDPEAARHGDTGSSTYGNNDAGSRPAWMAVADPGANVTFLVDSTSQGNFDPFGVIGQPWSVTVPFDTLAVFPESSAVPGYVLRSPSGSRADVQAAGSYSGGVWTLEMKRSLTTSGTEDSIQDVQFDDFGGSYPFGVAIFDNSGGSDHFRDSGPHTLVFEPTGVEESDRLPSSARVSPRLLPNFPNPFTQGTSIHYYLPARERVTIKVYDVTGRHMKTLVATEQTEGDYIVHWDGTNREGLKVESGLYFSVLKVGGIKLTDQLVFLDRGR